MFFISSSVSFLRSSRCRRRSSVLSLLKKEKKTKSFFKCGSRKIKWEKTICKRCWDMSLNAPSEFGRGKLIRKIFNNLLSQIPQLLKLSLSFVKSGVSMWIRRYSKFEEKVRLSFLTIVCRGMGQFFSNQGEGLIQISIFMYDNESSIDIRITFWLIFLLISHTSTQYMDFVDIFNILLVGVELLLCIVVTLS